MARSARSVLPGRVLVIVGALGIGLLFQHALAGRLEEIAELAKSDRTAARAELALLIRSASTAVLGATGTLGALIAWSCRNPRAAQRFPPRGWLSSAVRRPLSGPTARRMTMIGLFLGLALVAASAAGIALGWYIGAVLLACRA